MRTPDRIAGQTVVGETQRDELKRKNGEKSINDLCFKTAIIYGLSDILIKTSNIE